MRVSRCTQLKDALVGTGFPFKELSRLELYMRQLQTAMTSSAGGLVGDLQGGPGYLDSGDIAAATPKVPPQLLEALR